LSGHDEARWKLVGKRAQSHALDKKEKGKLKPVAIQKITGCSQAAGTKGEGEMTYRERRKKTLSLKEGDKERLTKSRQKARFRQLKGPPVTVKKRKRNAARGRERCAGQTKGRQPLDLSMVEQGREKGDRDASFFKAKGPLRPRKSEKQKRKERRVQK